MWAGEGGPERRLGRSLGGRGVEVVTGSHSAAEYVTYAQTAREFGLAASRGSGFHSADERWQVTGFVTNLADKEYITRGLHFTDFGFTVHYPGRPREWGASVSYRF